MPARGSTPRRPDHSGGGSDEGEARPVLLAWAFYDWANNAFATVILTFVFATYFTRSVAATPASGTTLWGYTLAAAGLTVSVFGPLAGAVADQAGRRKPWLVSFTLLCVGATAGLVLIRPDPGWVTPALVLLGLGSVGSELAVIFYNSLLPVLAPAERVGRWSGRGWALGYLGGVCCLLIALLLFLGQSPWIPLGSSAAAVRATCLLAAGWYLVFSLPLFFAVREPPGKTEFGRALGDGWAQLRGTLGRLHEQPQVLRFLIARTVYVNGLGTLFAFGGVYAAGTFGMDERAVLLFGLAITTAAGVGAWGLSHLDDRIGPKATIVIGLIGLIVLGGVALAVRSPPQFWAAGIALAIFVGPVQSASRSYFSRVAPARMRHELFGLYALSGKVVSFLGPLLVGYVTDLTGSQRAGMGVVVALFVGGLLLVVRVPRVFGDGRSS